MKTVVVFIAVCLFAVKNVSGWGQEGHKIVAQIAADRLSSGASNIASQFLGGDETLADIAPLPDDYDHSPQGRWSGPCHYCNLPRDATSFIMAYCPDLCVVKSIKNYSLILSQEAPNPFQCDYTTGVEPCAMEFLVHYVGDIHQPLHVSYGDDEGGNDVKVKFYGTSTNLHKVWDENMIQKWTDDYTSAVSELEDYISNNPDQINQYLAITDPILWANESFTYVLDTVYNFSDSTSTKKRAEPNLGDVYYDRNLPIVKQRLIAGGVRLGQLLNNLFSGDLTVIKRIWGY
jgi:hypothetical protein